MNAHAIDTVDSEVWTVSASEFPESGTCAEKLRFLVHYGILAPSNHNTQPWRFRVHGDVLELYADWTRACHVVDPNDRELIISCGAALFHIRVAARNFGYLGVTEICPEHENRDLLARFRLGAKQEGYLHDAYLMPAITGRRTYRLAFRDELVPDAVLWSLEKAAVQEQTWLHFIRDESTRTDLADLIAEGDRLQMGDPEFRRELASWLRSPLGRRHDGMQASAAGIGGIVDLSTPLAALAIRTFDLGNGKAAHDREIIRHSPVLAVLGTRNDVPEDWMAAGQALAKVLLRAYIDDVSASFLNQAIELRELRSRLSALIGGIGFPQMLIRLGYGTESLHATPRRPISEVMID